jgi:hypothetical protein
VAPTATAGHTHQQLIIHAPNIHTGGTAQLSGPIFTTSGHRSELYAKQRECAQAQTFPICNPKTPIRVHRNTFDTGTFPLLIQERETTT